MENMNLIPENYSKDYDTDNKKLLSILDQTYSGTSIRKVYNFGKVIGGGYFGIVREASLISDQSHKYAVKSIEKKSISKEVDLLLQEIKNLQAAGDHPNIVKLYEIYTDKNYVHMVTQNCEGGQVLAKLMKQKCFSEDIARQYMVQVLAAVRYLHEMDICHRDLKLENFLFYKKEDKTIIKLIDFGFSKRFGKDTSRKMHALVGSCFYVAPEVFDGNYDFKCDVWSCGIILHLFLFGYTPFAGQDDEETQKRIQKANIDFINHDNYKNLSMEVRELLSMMLNKDPKQRPTIEECQNHPWFTQVKDERTIPQEIHSVLETLAHEKIEANDFQKAVLNYMGYNLLDIEQIGSLVELFFKVDKDKSGFISKEELLQAFQENQISIDQDHFDQLITYLDYEGTGKIKYQAFISQVIDKKTFLNEENLRFAFNHYNADNNGDIDIDDIVEAMKREGRDGISIDRIKEILKDAGLGDKQQVSFEDFKTIMQQLIK